MKKIANFFIFTSNNLRIRYFYKYLREIKFSIFFIMYNEKKIPLWKNKSLTNFLRQVNFAQFLFEKKFTFTMEEACIEKCGEKRDN